MAKDVADRDGAKRIVSIRLKVGELSCVNLDSLRFAFSCISKGTIADGATLLIEHVKDESSSLEMTSIEVDY